jgi:hypothetical protein
MDFRVPEGLPAMPGTPFGADLAGTPFEGTINRYEEGKPGEPPRFIGTGAPYGDERFTKPRCFRNVRVVDAIRDLAVELGMDPKLLVVDPSCAKRFTGCFKKGSKKVDALWKLSDMCGYGVFPGPTDPAIGPVEPIGVRHGPYHEDRNVFQFERVYDDLDMPSHVEYFLPPYPGEKGFNVVIPVSTPYALPYDKWESHRVPRGTTEAEAVGAARRRAVEVAARGNVAVVAVPYNGRIGYRHQVQVRRPSKGFDALFMVVSLRHDFANDGWLTIFEGRYLDQVSYAPDPGGPGRGVRWAV